MRGTQMRHDDRSDLINDEKYGGSLCDIPFQTFADHVADGIYRARWPKSSGLKSSHAYHGVQSGERLDCSHSLGVRILHAPEQIFIHFSKARIGGA
jgi:hypothetical protein